MGWWQLKDNLNSNECLQIQLGKPNDEDQYCVEDFITWDTKTGELTETDREYIYNLIKQGFTSGEVNDWDQ